MAALYLQRERQPCCASGGNRTCGHVGPLEITTSTTAATTAAAAAAAHNTSATSCTRCIKCRMSSRTPMRFCITLHNGDFQGCWPVRGEAHLAWVLSAFNVTASEFRHYCSHAGTFNMLKAVLTIGEERQGGQGGDRPMGACWLVSLSENTDRTSEW